MTLGGIVKHLAWVENFWLTTVFAGSAPGEPWESADWDADADWEWHSAASDTPETLWALWQREVELADAVITQRRDADAMSLRSVGHPDPKPVSLRWILIHLIEEYARHNGHADLLRESIDGATGE